MSHPMRQPFLEALSICQELDTAVDSLDLDEAIRQRLDSIVDATISAIAQHAGGPPRPEPDDGCLAVVR